MLCAIAGISREAYYKYLRNKDKVTLNSQILEVIKTVQNETSYAIGHRPMKEECKWNFKHKSWRRSNSSFNERKQPVIAC